MLPEPRWEALIAKSHQFTDPVPPLLSTIDRPKKWRACIGLFDYPDEERERLLLERDERYAALGELLSRPPAARRRTSGPATGPLKERPERQT